MWLLAWACAAAARSATHRRSLDYAVLAELKEQNRILSRATAPIPEAATVSMPQLPPGFDGELRGIPYKLLPRKRIMALIDGREVEYLTWNHFKKMAPSREGAKK
jgi:hypothetical protein